MGDALRYVWRNRGWAIGITVSAVLVISAGFGAYLDLIVTFRGVEASGTVVDAYPTGRNGRSLDVRLVTSEGVVKHVTVADTWRHDNQIGDAVAIEYDPREPSNARLRDHHDLLWGPSALLWVGLLVGAALVAIRVHDRRSWLRRQRLLRAGRNPSTPASPRRGEESEPSHQRRTPDEGPTSAKGGEAP